MIGIPVDRADPSKSLPIPYQDLNREVQACYFPGSGVGGTFLAHLYNATAAMDIANDCIEVYKYIVEHYTGNQEIWMFGLSRGSYTVRSVGGMINNCGIIKQAADFGGLTKQTIDRLCNDVYQIYRSPFPEDEPHGWNSDRFRRLSHVVSTPIKFMGLLDTVGAMGVPKLDSGIGLTFPEFHDQKISSEVEKVYHACAIHDRLWMFEPCRAIRDPDPNRPWLEVHERWFPGCHYDLGRQRFQFFPNGEDVIQRLIAKALRPLGNIIEPNNVLADLVLTWMLDSIRTEDTYSTVIRDNIISAKIDALVANIIKAPETGSGDVYNCILEYGPAGRLLAVGATMEDAAVAAINRLSQDHLGTAFGNIFDLKLIVGTIAATRDRRIEDYEHHQAVVTRYDMPSNRFGNHSIETLARIDKKRYPSNTFENYQEDEHLIAMQQGAAIVNPPPYWYLEE
jgi:hypothetical protein